jgi:CRISPR-associated endonuclease/helicase Cas3
MTNLSARSFRTFFRAIHGCDPFPWQQRLVEQLHETGRWPEALDLPTGTGKTAALDAAVFHLALEAQRPERQAPLRILYVVDRRTIVDQAHERAKRIQAALREPTEPVLVAVKERLSGLSRDRTPLAVAVLRGGIARDDGWARAPNQPLIAVSTVDQVGSRLLFRGYGVSDSMRPIHAGLLANDALLLLDEVHLSEPFVETLEQLAERYMQWGEVPLARRWQWVPMSATPRCSRKSALRLAEEDERHPVLQRRLQASRPATLREVAARGDGDAAQRAFTGALCEEALRMARVGRAVAVVVNRVATARAAFTTLRDRLGDSAEVWLLTGRMRPLEREEAEQRLRARVGAGRTRRADERPAVIVATQCIEAGADLDFDGLVTECASLDALRQRFGRLNRLGDIDDAEGAILVRKDALKVDDPIYGAALAKTWAHLSKLDRVDFGLNRLRLPARKDLAELLPPVEHAPILLPAHLDAWVQTAPVPSVDPEVALWLHGPDRGQPEIQIVWRADISEAMLVDPDEGARAVECVESCPPSAPEALTVPLASARRWLARAGDLAGLPDVEGGRTLEDDSSMPRSPRKALVWRGEDSEVVGAGKIRPGDTIVVPSEYGGVADGNWAPDSQVPVLDLGDRAFGIRRGKPLLRLHPAVLGLHALPADDGTLPRWASPPVPPPEDGAERDDAALPDWLDSVIADPAAPSWLKATVASLSREFQGRRRPRLVRLEGGPKQAAHFVLAGRAWLHRGEAGEGEAQTTEDDTASFAGASVTLRRHQLAVADLAREYARGCGLPEELAEELALAGQWHDAGKADRRFQAMLHGGSTYCAEVAPELLAKSSIPAIDAGAREAARERAGYPRGARHELVSLMLMSRADALRAHAQDWELVQYLVASHHGHCRPFAPFAEDLRPVDVAYSDGPIDVSASSAHGLESFGSGVSDRFWRLVRRYGWFRLAWLEAIVRLADHRCSEHEQHAEEEGEA